MNVFRKRPLSLILCTMLGGFSLFIDADLVVTLSVIGVSILAFASTFIFGNLFRGRIAIARALTIAIAVSVSLALAYSLKLTANPYYGMEVTVTGKVTDVEATSSYSTDITLETKTLNGRGYYEKLLVTINPSESGGALVGDEVSVRGMINFFEAGTGSFDLRSYYVARGYTARMTDIRDFTILKNGATPNPGFFKTIQNSISSALMLATDQYTGGFLAALIMGNKDYLHPNTNLNYALIGISHILALSGMHLVILSEAVRYILSRFKLNKKIILLFSTLFCLLYMAVTGFSPSVVRSAVMLTITNGLFLLTGVHDSYTTLPLSVVIILLFQPHAVFDVGLWLSAFATLGVLVFGEIDRKREEKERGFFATILFLLWQSIFATILAVGASYILMLGLFDTTSFIAPITTLIFSFPINFLIFAGIGILILQPIMPWIGVPVIWLTDTINEAAEIMASWQWAIISLDFVAVRVLIIIFAVFFYSILVFKIDRFKLAIGMAVGLFLTSLTVGVVLTQSVRYADSLVLSPNDCTDMIIIKEEGSVTVIAPGVQSNSAAYENKDTITAEYITCIDNLVLADYTHSTINYLGTLLGAIKADILYIPEPHSTYEIAIAEGVADLLMTYGTDLSFYTEELGLAFGDYTYRMVDRNVFRGEDNADYIFTLSRGDTSYTYISDGATEQLAATSKITGYTSEKIIFGSRGSHAADTGSFALVSENVQQIYYIGKLPLADTSVAYYDKKGVPIKKIGTQYELYVE